MARDVRPLVATDSFWTDMRHALVRAAAACRFLSVKVLVVKPALLQA